MQFLSMAFQIRSQKAHLLRFIKHSKTIISNTKPNKKNLLAYRIMYPSKVIFFFHMLIFFQTNIQNWHCRHLHKLHLFIEWTCRPIGVKIFIYTLSNGPQKIKKSLVWSIGQVFFYFFIFLLLYIVCFKYQCFVCLSKVVNLF